MQITIRTREVDGVSVTNTVHLTPYYLGHDVLAKATSREQAGALLGLVAGLLGFDPEGRHRAHMQAAYLADDLVKWHGADGNALASETIDWLRAVADLAEAAIADRKPDQEG